MGIPHRTNATSAALAVVAPPSVELVTWVSAEGYQLPIPKDWTRHENWTSGGTPADLFLEGTYDGTPATLLVDSNETAGVREDRAYLSALVNDTIASLRQREPGLTVSGETFETLSGHAAVVFVLHYGSLLYQDIAIVVSEPHQRIWLIILTAAAGEERNLNGTFDQILQGFQITAAAPQGPSLLGAPTLWLLVIGVAVVAVVGVVVVLLVVRARHRKALARPPPPQPPLG